MKAQVVGHAVPRRWAVQRRPHVETLAKWLPAVVILALWEFGSGVFIDESLISRPTAVVRRLLTDDRLMSHTLVTTGEILAGWAIGVVVGSVLGYLAGISEPVGNVIQPYALLVNSIPKVAIAPLMIVWFGVGPWSKVIMGSLMVCFVVFFNVFVGVRSIHADYLHLARIMGARERDLFWRVVMPFVSPYLLVSIRQGITFAVIGVLIGEFIASSKGVGYYLQFASGSFDAAGIFAGVIVLLVLVLVLNMLVTLVERRVLRWQPPRAAARGRPA